ncbi:MAG: DNA-binding protein [Nocardiopsaceae bacterium]|nr:DNA-binding protein [Nocardiopsaceae bacterium]
MARRRGRVSPEGVWEGTLFLDSHGLSELVSGRTSVTSLFIKSGEMRVKRAISALTLIEVQHPGIDKRRLRYILSCLEILDVTKDIAAEAVALLHSTEKHGHSDAIDAVVAATALRQPAPVLMLTSDPDDMNRLCDGRVRITAV